MSAAGLSAHIPVSEPIPCVAIPCRIPPRAYPARGDARVVRGRFDPSADGRRMTKPSLRVRPSTAPRVKRRGSRDRHLVLLGPERRRPPLPLATDPLDIGVIPGRRAVWASDWPRIGQPARSS